MVAMRIRDRTVHEIGPDTYEIAMVLTGPSREDIGGTADATDEAVFATLNRPGGGGGPAGSSGGNLMWASSGDENKAGWPHEPTTGLLSIIEDPTPDLFPWRFEGIQVDGDGTLDRIELLAFTAGIPHLATCTVTWSILINGVAIAEETEVVPQGLYFWGSRALVIAENVTVANGDVVAASVTSVPSMPYFRVPSGVGGQDERLRIIGGSLT